jgi:hypothetical protein
MQLTRAETCEPQQKKTGRTIRFDHTVGASSLPERWRARPRGVAPGGLAQLPELPA